MNAVSDWSQTPGGLLRNRGLVTAPDAAAKAAALLSPDRLEARRLFRESHAGVLEIQEALAERGWTGCWVDMPTAGLPDPSLAPLYAGARAAQARLVKPRV